jgi:hypothetical protein
MRQGDDACDELHIGERSGTPGLYRHRLWTRLVTRPVRPALIRGAEHVAAKAMGRIKVQTCVPRHVLALDLLDSGRVEVSTEPKLASDAGFVGFRVAMDMCSHRDDERNLS